MAFQTTGEQFLLYSNCDDDDIDQHHGSLQCWQHRLDLCENVQCVRCMLLVLVVVMMYSFVLEVSLCELVRCSVLNHDMGSRVPFISNHGLG